MKKELLRKDLLYPEESYKIIGILFDVYNELGPGHHEKYYQRAISHMLKKHGIDFQEQFYTPLYYRGITIGKQFFDFLIENKIILEIKKGDKFSHHHIKQVSSYLKTSGYKLAILANFGRNGITFKRIINLDS